MSVADHVGRFLELVRRDVAADDVHFEIGGRGTNEDERRLVVPLEGGWRLIVAFDAAVADPTRTSQRIRTLAEPFGGVLADLRHSAPIPELRVGAPDRADELARILDLLCDRTGADAALVVDAQTPVVWGASRHGSWVDDVEQLTTIGRAISAALDRGLDSEQVIAGGDLGEHTTAAQGLFDGHPDAPARVGTLVGLAHARDDQPPAVVRRPQSTSLVRRFAGIYRVLLSFTGEFSELHATTQVGRALPIIERLTDALPPHDPGPKGGRVVQLLPEG